MAGQTINIPNFRDVGGRRAADGRTVRAGRLYRSVALDAVGEEDLQHLSSLGITTVFDMRRPDEQEQHPDRLPDGASLVSLDVLADAEQEGTADVHAVFAHLRDPQRLESAIGVADMERFTHATYADLVSLPSARAGYARFYRLLATSDGASLVHCTAGKDRTGWAVAALLAFLGVSRDAIVRDYLVSDAIIRDLFAEVMDGFAARGGRREVLEPMFAAREDYLDVAFATVSAEHGSIEAYFGEGLGLAVNELGALRETFLE